EAGVRATCGGNGSDDAHLELHWYVGRPTHRVAPRVDGFLLNPDLHGVGAVGDERHRTPSVEVVVNLVQREQLQTEAVLVPEGVVEVLVASHTLRPHPTPADGAPDHLLLVLGEDRKSTRLN